MSARVYFMRRVNDCKDVSKCLRKMNSEDGQVYSVVYCNFLVLLSTTVCSQNIDKQNVNIADETLTDYSFLRRYQELFEKTISNSSLNSHVFWDTLYVTLTIYCLVFKSGYVFN